MASVTNIINVCDLCGSEEDAKTRTVRIDRRTAELEVCPGCWIPFKEIADKLIAAGRRVDVPTRAAKKSTSKASAKTSGEKPRTTRPATKAAAKKTATAPAGKKTATRAGAAKKSTSKAAAK